MSDSKPPSTHNNRRRHRTGESSVWFGWSIALHIVALGVLVYLTPLRDMVAEQLLQQRPPTPRSMSERDVREVAEHVTEFQSIQIRQDVERLEEIRDEMEKLREEQLAQLETSQKDLVTQAPDEAMAAMERAIEAQRQASEALDKATDAESVDPAARAALNRAYDARQAQRDAVAQLGLGGDPLVPALREQEAATRAQDAATGAMQATVELLKNASDLRGQLKRKTEEADKGREELEKHRAAVESATRKVVEANDRLTQRQANVNEKRSAELKANEALESARADQEAKEKALKAARDAKQPTRELEQAASAARKARDSAQARQKDAKKAHDSADNELRKAQRSKTDAEGNLTKAQDRVTKAADLIAKREEELKQLEAQIAVNLKSAADKVASLKAAQVIALGSQEKARDALRNALTRSASLASTTQPAEPTTRSVAPVVIATTQEATPTTMPIVATPAPEDLTRPAIATNDPAQLYQHARNLEKQILDTYRQVRAAELAAIQEISLTQAISLVDVPETLRPEASDLMPSSTARTAEELEALKSQITAVAQETTSIRASSESMYHTAAAMKQTASDALGGAMSQLARDRIAHAQAMQRAAAENPDQRAADLTALMSSSQGGGGAASAQSGGEGNNGLAGSNLPSHPSVPKEFKAVPGTRRFTRDGKGAEWSFVDTWWLLGPFPNPDRRNIHRQFPPETVIDLDAAYRTDDGRLLTWRYLRSKDAKIFPTGTDEYEIWYAYTELYFDQPTDLWVAVGSDDRSDIWLNDQKIWASSDALKAWRAGEGYRKIRFEKGYNKILYRIENGHGGMGFSFVLHTEQPGRTGK